MWSDFLYQIYPYVQFSILVGFCFSLLNDFSINAARNSHKKIIVPMYKKFFLCTVFHITWYFLYMLIIFLHAFPILNDFSFIKVGNSKNNANRRKIFLYSLFYYKKPKILPIYKKRKAPPPLNTTYALSGNINSRQWSLNKKNLTSSIYIMHDKSNSKFH